MGYAAMKKKGESGEIKKYISRMKAMKKLQLSLEQFRRLCISKNVFPIEPKHRIRVQGGSSKYRPLYLKKDIRFMLHDQNIVKYREEDALEKKIVSAKGLHAVTKLATLRKSKPVIKLEHNLKERYPSFLDAIKDLPDCLNMVFLFSQVAAYHPIKEHHITRARRLTNEFLTYVIEARCLTKSFIATNGIYFEAEILKVPVVWCVPHSCNTTIPVNADLDIMKHYLEFFLTMLAHVNKRLLGKVDMRYPLMPAVVPGTSGKQRKDLDNYKSLMESLNYPLVRTKMREEHESGQQTKNIKKMLKRSTDETRRAYKGAIDKELRTSLFEDQVFFISRECNRTLLTFMIRACGGKVGWDNTLFPCSHYNEDDKKITHHIVDKPGVEIKHLSRSYIQPVYVFDCINSATLLPVQKYVPGATLPPHVSPFLRETPGYYIPPEEETLRKLLEADAKGKEAILQELEQEDQHKQLLISAAKQEKETADALSEAEEGENSGDEADDTMEEGEEEEKDGEDEEETVDVDMDAEEETLAKHGEKSNRRGKEKLVLENWEQKKEEARQLKMQEKMLPRADRLVYQKLKKKEGKIAKKANYLKERRETIDKAELGLVSQEEVDFPKVKKVKKTMAQKRGAKFSKKIKESVAFSKEENKRYRAAKKSQTKK